LKKSLVIHSFLFAITPILFLFSHNVEQVSLSEMFLPSAIVLGFTLLLVLLSRLIFRDIKKAAILISISLVLFFSYGHIYDLITDWHINSFTIGRHRYLMLAWGFLFTCSAYLTIRTRRDLHNVTTTLNIVALSLVVIPLLNIGVYELKTKNTWQDTSKSMEGSETTTTNPGNGSAFRDIYYIILDGYASSATLKEVYGYDNQNFIDYLISKDFYIASKSRSNYAITFLSLASSLNMKYVNYLTDMVGIESIDRTLPYQMIEDSKVMNVLKLTGYKFIHFSSGWGATDRNRYADLDIHCGMGNEFLMVLIQTTMLNPFERYFAFIKGDARKRILCTFSELAKVHRIEGPKFVFAHINSPHPPYLFGANGEPVPDAKLKMSGSVWKQKEKYLNQLIFVNKKVEMIVDEILIKSESFPIIILQSDHGPASTFTDPDSGGWERPTENMLRERTRIFNAYYLPSGGDHLLYDSMTPVNTFRLIFNFYFNTTYELLNGRTYYSTYTRPYEFINVTDKVKYH